MIGNLHVVIVSLISMSLFAFFFYFGIQKRPPKHTCGGTLIARDIVLCAAHCYDPRDPPTKVRVGAYTERDYRNYNGNQPFHDAKILNVIPHPRFNMNSMDFDVALFRIEPVTDRELIRSIVKIDCKSCIFPVSIHYFVLTAYYMYYSNAK